MTSATAAQKRMPLEAHVREACTRATRAAVALVVAAIAGYLFSDHVLAILRAPIVEIAESHNASLNYDSVTGAFDLRLRIAVLTGIVLSSPIWLYQLFAFLTPGLTRREKRYTFGFLAAALPLFAAGCLAGFLMFPHMVQLLLGFADTEDSTLLSAGYYFDFVMKVVIATGVAFVLPVFLVVLNFAGILSARAIAKSWRISVIAIVVFSALVTPAADVLSMFLVAAPMTALFLTALLIAHLHDRAAEAARRRLTDPATVR